MKLSCALILAAAASFASATTSTTTIKNKASAKMSLLKKARRLEDQNQDQGDDAAQDEQYQWLATYSLKMIGCSATQYTSPENGEYEYQSVVFRLCPSDECDDESSTGCGGGYGDYVVGINSFVEAWLEDKREDMENDQDDQWDMNQFAECREYEADQDADDENANQNNAQYYVGPTCIDDGSDIAIGFFSDYTCTTVPEDVTFEDISNGWSLPYSEGGLVTSYCESCYGYNDNGEQELSEMCMQLYEFSSYKCEQDMEYYSQYGMNDQGCEYIAENFPSTVASSGSKAGIIIMWIIIALLILGAGFFLYTKWWMKRKQGAAAASGLSTSDGVAA